jgi:hypothetical protein
MRVNDAIDKYRIEWNVFGDHAVGLKLNQMIGKRTR